MNYHAHTREDFAILSGQRQRMILEHGHLGVIAWCRRENAEAEDWCGCVRRMRKCNRDSSL